MKTNNPQLLVLMFFTNEVSLITNGVVNTWNEHFWNEKIPFYVFHVNTGKYFSLHAPLYVAKSFGCSKIPCLPGERSSLFCSAIFIKHIKLVCA